MGFLKIYLLFYQMLSLYAILGRRSAGRSYPCLYKRSPPVSTTTRPQPGSPIEERFQRSSPALTTLRVVIARPNAPKYSWSFHVVEMRKNTETVLYFRVTILLDRWGGGIRGRSGLRIFRGE